MFQIRTETEDDIAKIHKVTELAFRGRPYADGDEQDLIDRLRRAKALTVSLVAIDDSDLVGQITFSPAMLNGSSKPWFALGPVAVTPERQGEGIGAALIERGLAEIQKLDARGCILTGNPDYYRRFGFELSPNNVPPKEPAEFFMLKIFGANKPEGLFAFHPAFYE